MSKSYKNPAAFKRGLEDRIKARARAEGSDINRLRQLLIFERFLSRVYECWGEAVILKGGYALELRLARARTTKDVDLRLIGDMVSMIAKLQEIARQQGSDYLSFEVRNSRNHSEMHGEQIVYEGIRLDIVGQLAGQSYGAPFHLDISMADKIILPPDSIKGTNFFEFAGLEPLSHDVYPVEAHIAEKLHALSFPRPSDRPNSRLKDLVDIGLLADHCELQAEKLIKSIRASFEFRAIQPVPQRLPEPPLNWEVRYGSLRDEDELRWQTLHDLQKYAESFLNPLLTNPDMKNWWRPELLRWSAD